MGQPLVSFASLKTSKSHESVPASNSRHSSLGSWIDAYACVHTQHIKDGTCMWSFANFWNWSESSAAAVKIATNQHESADQAKD